MSWRDTDMVLIMAVSPGTTSGTTMSSVLNVSASSSTEDNFNSTMLAGPQPPYWDIPLVIILPIILFVVMVTSLIGNGLIILSIIFFRGMRSKTNLFITNLACADFGVSLLCMPFSLATVIQGDWMFGPVFCTINAFLEALFLVTSTHSLMAIALHKFASLVLPLKRLINRRRAVGMMAFTWFIGFTCAIGPIVGLSKNVYKPGTSQCGPKYPEKLSEVIIGLYVPIVGIIIPLICLVISYSVIFNAIRKYSKRLRHHTSMTEDKIFHQQKRITITLFIVFVTFLICWSPYFVYTTLGFSVGFKRVPTILNVVAYWSGYTNSALNPLIYAWRARSYREAFKKICCCDVQSGIISDGTVNNLGTISPGNFSSRGRKMPGNFSESGSPASLRHSHIYKTSLQGVPPFNLVNSSLVPGQFPGYQPMIERPHNDIQLQELSRNEAASKYDDAQSEDDDDVFLLRQAVKRCNSENDKESLARRHFDVLPKVRVRQAHLSDPGRLKVQGKKPTPNEVHQEEQSTPNEVTYRDWTPDDKAMRALLGRSTIV